MRNNDLVTSGKEFNSCQIKGETISLWVPLVLALIGIVNSIFIVQSFVKVDTDLKAEFLFSWSPSFSNKNKPKVKASTTDEVKNLAESKYAYEEQDSKSIVTELKHQIDPTTEDLKSENKIHPLVKNTVNSATTYKDKVNVLAGSDQIVSAADSVLSSPPPLQLDGIAEIIKNTEHKFISDTSVNDSLPTTVEQRPSLIQDCPSLFFFAFSRNSVIPNEHNLSAKIKRLTDWLEQHNEIKIFIEGHTDSFGTEEYNLLLSYRRAKAAENILIKAGISKKQLITRALGEQEPLQDQPTQSKNNRRVSIRTEATQNCINNLINGDSN